MIGLKSNKPGYFIPQEITPEEYISPEEYTRLQNIYNDWFFDACDDPAALLDEPFDIEEINIRYIKSILCTNKHMFVKKNIPNLLLVNAGPKTPKKPAEKNIVKKEPETTDLCKIIAKFGLSSTVKSDNFDDICTPEENERCASDSEDDETPEFLSKPRPNIIKIDLGKKTKVDTTCPDCRAPNSMIEDDKNSYIVCTKCGFQKEALLINAPEWHQYGNDDGRGEGVSRCGSTTSHNFPKSSQGTSLIGLNKNLQKKQSWNSSNYKENKLNEGFESISKICVKNKIPKRIKEEAQFLYKKVSESKHIDGPRTGKPVIVRGPTKENIIGACIYKACENLKDPRSKKEIAQMIGIDSKRVSKGIKKFENTIKYNDRGVLENLHDGTAEDAIRKYCTKIRKIPPEDVDLAVKMANNCSRLKIATDHGSISIAAGIAMLMCVYRKIDVDKSEIAEKFGTTQVTIARIFNKTVDYLAIIIDDECTDYIIEKFKING